MIVLLIAALMESCDLLLHEGPYRANKTHVRQSKPDSGVGFQGKVLNVSCSLFARTFYVFPPSLGPFKLFLLRSDLLSCPLFARKQMENNRMRAPVERALSELIHVLDLPQGGALLKHNILDCRVHS